MQALPLHNQRPRAFHTLTLALSCFGDNPILSTGLISFLEQPPFPTSVSPQTGTYLRCWPCAWCVSSFPCRLGRKSRRVHSPRSAQPLFPPARSPPTFATGSWFAFALAGGSRTSVGVGLAPTSSGLHTTPSPWLRDCTCQRTPGELVKPQIAGPHPQVLESTVLEKIRR